MPNSGHGGPTGTRVVTITFINMVITGVENGSPDMILVAFEGKFDEIPSGICRPHMLEIFQYWGCGR